MTRKEKRKSSRMRGKTTHGWGSMKKHRGAGNRGGKGNAGSTKQKAQSYPLKGANKKGFKNLNSNKIINIAINICDLNIIVNRMLKTGKITSDKDISIDLNLLGINKLLGKGKLLQKINVNVDNATESAKKKVEAAGGTLKVLESIKETESSNEDDTENE